MAKTKTLQFKVPQNVQREDTIIGPITLKQLVILGIGGGIAYALYISLAKTYFIEVWLPPVAIVSVITLAFAFLKIHSLPFHIFLMNLVEYNLLPKKRVWIQGTGYANIPLSGISQKRNEKHTVQEKTAKPEDEILKLSKLVDAHNPANPKK